MVPLHRKAVLITGASSGIGRASVDAMVRSNWQVFATVRKAQDADRLKSNFGANVIPVIMDVTDPSSITAAAQMLATHLQSRGLDGLVNVAGIGKVLPVEYMSRDVLVDMFDINVFGQIAVTRAFLPLISQARGRIVNITSIGAHIAMPFASLINASKAAFNIFSDTLRLELHPFGIQVSAIEPGAIATPAVDKTLGDTEAVIRSLPSDGASKYGQMLREFMRRGLERETHGSPPEVVAKAVHHALTAARPRTRYRVGKHATLLGAMAWLLPDRLLDAVRFRVAGMPTTSSPLAAQPDHPAARAA